MIGASSNFCVATVRLLGIHQVDGTRLQRQCHHVLIIPRRKCFFVLDNDPVIAWRRAYVPESDHFAFVASYRNEFFCKLLRPRV